MSKSKKKVSKKKSKAKVSHKQLMAQAEKVAIAMQPKPQAAAPEVKAPQWDAVTIAKALNRFSALLEKAEAKAEAAPVETKAKKKKAKKTRKALGRGMEAITRTDEVLQVLRRRRDKSATLSQIVSSLGHDSYQQKFYGNTCLNLLARGVVKRKKVDGVFLYTLKTA